MPAVLIGLLGFLMESVRLSQVFADFTYVPVPLIPLASRLVFGLMDQSNLFAFRGASLRKQGQRFLARKNRGTVLSFYKSNFFFNDEETCRPIEPFVYSSSNRN